MFAKRKQLTIVGIVCALFVLPVMPPSIEVGQVPVPLVPLAVGQPAVTMWENLTDDVWTCLTCWSFGVPDLETQAEHLTQASTITVDIPNAGCAKFTGDGDSPSDRFMLMDAAKKLCVAGDMIKTGTKHFVVKFRNGIDANNRTWLDVGGNVTGFDFIPAPGFGLTGEYVKIEIGSFAQNEVLDTRISLGNHADIDIRHNVTDSVIEVGNDGTVTIGESDSVVQVIDTPLTIGDNCTVQIGTTNPPQSAHLRGAEMRFGTAAALATEVTDVDLFGRAGLDAPGNRVNEDWTLRGNADVDIRLDFVAEEPVLDHPLVEQTQFSQMTVHRTTIGGDWHVFDHSIFRAEDAQQNGQRIESGEWEIEDSGMVFAGEVDMDTENGVQFGDWTVKSKGANPQGGDVGLSVDAFLNPNSLVVVGGSVKCNDLGFIPGPPAPIIPVWDLTISKLGEVDVGNDAWHNGEHPQGDPNLGGFSKLTYSSRGNTYNVAGDWTMMGELTLLLHKTQVSVCCFMATSQRLA